MLWKGRHQIWIRKVGLLRAIHLSIYYISRRQCVKETFIFLRFCYLHLPLKTEFIEHDANGVGWGNSMRALYNSFGLASLMNRRLIIRFITLSKLWDPPYGGTAWDHGLVKNTYSWGYNDKSLTYKWFEFEKYGRGDLTSSSASKFDMFIGNLSM